MPKGGPDGRFFLIFEARVDNAHPQKIGFEGCRAVVKFWRDLSDENDASKRATRLEDFYYKGAPGVSGPVVQAKNYGGPLGQVRGNLFINAPGKFKWELREWIVINSGAPTPASFTPVTVKENPLAEFYSDTTGPNTLDVPLETTERTEFQTQFKNTFLKRLVEPDVLRQFLTNGQSGYVPELDPKSTRRTVHGEVDARIELTCSGKRHYGNERLHQHAAVSARRRPILKDGGEPDFATTGVGSRDLQEAGSPAAVRSLYS